ncbi:unnamed protein product [Discula destructiva]
MASSVESFVVHDNEVTALFGPSPRLELLAENTEYPAFHEAGVYCDQDQALFITSNQFVDPVGKKTVQISKVTLDRSGGKITAKVEEIHPGIPMGNGGVKSGDRVLFCAQGGPDNATDPSALVYMDSRPPYATQRLVSSFHGRAFNSLNDVVVHSDGSVWFTDPIYGFEQGFRPKPELPCQVYRCVPGKGADPAEGSSIRAMADGFGRPNGICFSPDEKVVYVTDTDWIHGDGTMDDSRPSTIYAFDVAYYSGQPFLINRRLFAFADKEIPDGIKCDVHGNVYSGCGDGVNVWSPGGVLLGRILVEGGAANFCFGREGEMFILNEHKLWRAQLATSTKGALLGI